MTNTTTKLTKVQKFEMLANIEDVKNNPMLADFIAREIELLKNRKTGERKPTATQKANQDLMDKIHEAMADGELYSVSDLLKTVDVCAGLSNQKVSAMMRIMEDAKRVERVIEKRQSKFRKIAE